MTGGRERARAAAERAGPTIDNRKRKRCYLCRKPCVVEGLRYWARRPDQLFICPWCKGRNFKFIWACVQIVRQLATKICPKAGDNKHDYNTCQTPQCLSRRVMRTRRAIKPQ